jgi:hypothetical protein
MKGSAILAGFPESGGEIDPSWPGRWKRDRMIYEHVRAGHFVPIVWRPLIIDRGPYRLVLYVSSDALRLGDESDSFRPEVTAYSAQRIADWLNAVVPTPQIVDEIWRQADVRLDPPITRGASPLMGSTTWMREYNKDLDAKVGGLVAAAFGSEYDPLDLLVAHNSKDWTNSRWLSQTPIPLVAGQIAAENYGLLVSRKFVAPGSLPLVQSPVSFVGGDVGIWQAQGHRHDRSHTDYSQLLRLVHRIVFVCGPTPIAGLGFGDVPPCIAKQPCKLPGGGMGELRCLDIYNVALDATLVQLINHDGILYMRQPDVAFTAPPTCAAPAPSLMLGDACTLPTPPPPKPFIPPMADIPPPLVPIVEPPATTEALPPAAYSHPFGHYLAAAAGFGLGAGAVHLARNRKSRSA